ncbi:hypothetical protein EIP86_002719 [Pleurotus ostreatoroseus]|nr:hypothetical protein EIP86_002719 [Pleurotus ostreatoroseus]
MPTIAQSTLAAIRNIMVNAPRDPYPQLLLSQSNMNTTISLFAAGSGWSESPQIRLKLDALRPDLLQLMSSVYSLSGIEALCVMDNLQPDRRPYYDVQLIRNYWNMFLAMPKLRMLSLSSTFLVDFARELLGAGPESCSGVHYVFPCLTHISIEFGGLSDRGGLHDIVPLLPRQEEPSHAIEQIHVCNADVPQVTRLCRKWTKAHIEGCKRPISIMHAALLHWYDVAGYR